MAQPKVVVTHNRFRIGLGEQRRFGTKDSSALFLGHWHHRQYQVKPRATVLSPIPILAHEGGI